MRKLRISILLTSFFLLVFLFQNCGEFLAFSDESNAGPIEIGDTSSVVVEQIDEDSRFSDRSDSDQEESQVENRDPIAFPIVPFKPFIPVVSVTPAEKVDSQNCFTYGKDDSRGYHIRARKSAFSEKSVFYNSSWAPSADPDQFRAFQGSAFGRTPERLFWKDNYIADLHPDDIIELDWTKKFLRIPRKKSIFFNGKRLPVDYDSFEVMSGNEPFFGHRYKDRFLTNSHDKNAQPGSHATHIGKNYFRLDGKIYYGDKFLSGAHPETFQLVGDLDAPVARDGLNIYFQNIKVTTDFGRQILPLGESETTIGYYHDGSHVFYRSEKMGLLSQFQDLGENWVQIGQKIYYQGRFVTKDDSSFRVLSHAWAADRSRAYFNGRGVVARDGDDEAFDQEMNLVAFVSGEWAFIDDQFFSSGRESMVLPEGVDPASIRCIGEDYIKIADKVYSKRLLDVTEKFSEHGMDLSSLDDYTGDGWIFYDHKGFFSSFLKSYILHEDPTSFTPVNRALYFSDGKFHRASNSVGAGINQINEQKLQLSDIKMLTDSSLVFKNGYVGRNFYQATSTHVLRHFGGRRFLFDQGFTMFGGPLVAADHPASFDVISDDIAHDNVAVYFKGKKVSTKQNVTDTPHILPIRDYWAVGDKVFYNDLELENSSVSSFARIADPNQEMTNPFVESNGNVYYHGVKISEDPRNFSILQGQRMWKDGGGAGYLDKVCQDLTTQDLDHRILNSVHGVIYGGGRYCVNGQSVEATGDGTLQTFGYVSSSGKEIVSRYWSNGQKVFYLEKEVQNAKADTFSVTNYYQGTDGVHCFSNERQVPCP